MKSIDYITGVVCICVVILSLIIGVTWYNVNDRNLMSKNISEAVTKGMDPLSVRCSYAHAGDTICIAYAASGKK